MFPTQQFYTSLTLAKQVTDNMQLYINELKNRPGKPEYEDKKQKELYVRQKQLNTILACIINSEQVVNDLLEHIESEYKRGFVAGIKKAQKNYDNSRVFFNKEAYRNDHATRIQQKWQELY